MATVIYYPDGPQGEPQTYTVSHLAQWVVMHAPRTDRLYVCQGEIALENTIRPEDITNEILGDPGAVFHISPVAFGPEIWIPIIVSVIVSVAAVLLVGAPDVPDLTNANQSSSNALQGRANEPRVNQRLPDIFGTEVKAYPDLWSAYRIFDNNIEFEVSYMCLSVGLVDVDSSTVRDGGTLAADIAGTSVEFYGPGTSPNSGSPFLQIGDPIPDALYAVRQSNEVDGITLLAPNEYRINTQFRVYQNGRLEPIDIFGNINPDIDFTSVFSVGDTVNCVDFYSFEYISIDDNYVRRNANGGFTVTAVSKSLLTLDVSGNTSWLYFAIGGEPLSNQAWYNSLLDRWQPTDPSDPDYTLIVWDPYIQRQSELDVGPYDCSNTDQTWVNLVAQQGIFKKAQVPVFFTIDFRVTFRNKDFPVLTTIYNVSMSSNAEDAVQSTFRFNTPYTNCEIAIERLTDTDKEFSGNVVDTVKWRDLYLVDNVTNSNFGNLTTIHAKTRATDAALRQKERKLSCKCTRYVTRPDTSFVASDEFADVVYALHTDPFIGRRDATSIDVTQLYALQEEMVTYYGRGRDPIRVGFTFDDDTYRYEDHLSLICQAVNVQPYQVGNLIKFHFEGPQEFSVQQFGHRSKVPGAEERRTRSLHPPEDYDGVELTYKDETTGDFETIYVPSDRSAANPEIVEYKGCFIARNAQTRADRLRNKQRYQRVTHEFNALDKARLLAQGQRVDVIDNTRYAPNSGYIDTVAGLTYYLSQPTDLAPGSTASIVLTKRDGTLEGIPVTIVDEDSVLLDYAPAEAPYTGYLADRTEYSLATDDVRSSLAMLVTKIEPRDTDDVKVTCVNYDDRYYDGDLD